MPSHPGRKYICSWERGIKAGSKLISPSSKTISRGSERAKGGKGNIVQELVGEPGVPVVMEISHKIDNSAPLAIFGDIDRNIRQPKHGHLQTVRGSLATQMSAPRTRSPESPSLSAEGSEGRAVSGVVSSG